jgi:protein phosphatase PTC7
MCTCNTPVNGIVEKGLHLLQVFSVKVQADDIVVLGSDGLFDNVFPEESAAITSLIQGRGDPPQVAAAGLAQFASIR